MNTYNFAVIGCGRIAKNHLEAIQNIPQAKLAAVAEIKQDKLQAAIEKYNCQGYQDYREMLKNPHIDIVNICTESGYHAQIAIDALQAGKHVLVEKPMAMSLLEADKMIATAKKYNRKLGVVHQNRFNSAIVSLRRAVEEKKFGNINYATANIRWCRDDNYYAQAPWRGTWAQDGGCLMNQSIHNIDLLQWMLGDVQSVFAYADTKMRKIEAEDLAVAVLKFKSGALAMIEATTTIYPKNLEETLNIFGTQGTVCIGGIAVNKIENWQFATDDAYSKDEYNTEPPDVYGFGHIDIVKDMISAIEENRQTAICGTEGRKALEIILGIYHSVRLNKEIHFPLQEEFRIGLDNR